MQLKVKPYPDKRDNGICRVTLDTDERAVLGIVASMDSLMGRYGEDVVDDLRETLKRIDARKRVSEAEYRDICVWLQSIAAMVTLARRSKMPTLPDLPELAS